MNQHSISCSTLPPSNFLPDTMEPITCKLLTDRLASGSTLITATGHTSLLQACRLSTTSHIRQCTTSMSFPSLSLLLKAALRKQNTQLAAAFNWSSRKAINSPDWLHGNFHALW
mmetsp:Transcript_28317/g.76480  ORF Transcript_28317/g.76480 Transcript_28317/m.76480 type:complete len:114 (-) Transcript_28317:281-622(-)